MGQQKKPGLILVLLALGCVGHADSAPVAERSPLTRTASGAPAAGYWQQQVDHVIDISLDLQQQRWRGSQLVTYVNASPDPLRYLWLRLNPSPGTSDALIEVEQVLDASGIALATHRFDDRLRVDLPNPVEPGESLRFSMAFSLALPPDVDAGPTRLYPGVGFYPRLVAYTDTSGWDHASADGGRELGSFLVRITVPDPFLVAAGGELLNPREVLDPRPRDRLDAARNGRAPVVVIGPRAALQQAQRAAAGSRTWVFAGESLRDFAFAAATGYVWEARRASAGGPLLMTYYPAQANSWRHDAMRALDDVIESGRQLLGDYPWPVATVILGDTAASAGMFNVLGGVDHNADVELDISADLAQALAGSWLSQMVGAADPWMDELLTQLAAGLAVGPGRQEGEDSASTGFGSGPAGALAVLREEILGAEAFDFALAEFIQRWRFRRAAGEDFQRSLADASGRPMDWFWPGWRQAGRALDLSIDSLSPRPSEKDAPAWVVRVRNASATALPATLQIHYADGSMQQQAVAAGLWREDPHAARINIEGSAQPASLQLLLPAGFDDIDPANNRWPPAVTSPPVSPDD